MFRRFKELLSDFMRSRLLILGIIFIVLFTILIGRLFHLQIVEGENYLSTFNVKIKKERSLPCARGLIYDRNGVLLAYNELVYSVVIEDNGDYENLEEKNEVLNAALVQLFGLIENHGDSVVRDFEIVLDASGQYAYASVSDSTRLRFIADVLNVQKTSDLSEAQENTTAEEIMSILRDEKHYNLDDSYTKEEALKIVMIRYGMTQNNYQKYVTTTVAEDISEETAAVILEHQEELPGVSIEEDTIRRYHEDNLYMAHILGYTGQVSEQELPELQAMDEKYNASYMVGKLGIEQSMENVLQGTQGEEVFYVDNLGKVIEVESSTEPKTGNDVHLTIDLQLQKTVYHILEQHLAGILVSKIVTDSAYETRQITGSDNVVISIDDVYFSLIDNNVIDIHHFDDEDASETERYVYQLFLQKKETVNGQIRQELESASVEALSSLTTEMQGYMQYAVEMLLDDEMILKSELDTADAVYRQWTEGDIGAQQFLKYCISKNWINVQKIPFETKYADADEIYTGIVDYLFAQLETDTEFHKKIYEYLILDRSFTGQHAALILYDQGILAPDEGTYSGLMNGSVSAYSFMIGKIQNLEITPAQLALDPCSASTVITDVNTGEVLALVTYPSYDSNRLANRVDADYYSELLNDKSLPLFNRATQQKTAPGSTYKMLTATAGLEEGVITLDETIQDEGIFTKIDNHPKCWIYPGKHGALRVSEAIRHSCNYFFYEVGYRLSIDEDGDYNDAVGTEALTKYAQMFGFDKKSGVEITEAEPQISDVYPVMTAIGQARNNYTTVQMSKYISAVASRGNVYNLTLIDKTTDSEGNIIEDYTGSIDYTMDVKASTWNALHVGMRAMAENTSILNRMSVAVAGKTGTAQEDTTRANHALFVGFAPYESPEITIATRIAYGYTSSNAVEIARDVLNYYFGITEYEEVVTGRAVMPGSTVIHD